MKQKLIISAILVLLTNLCFSQNYSLEISKYVTFIESQNTSAKDYILDLFKKYDIVVLCERHHGEMTQYDLIYDIVSSNYFQKNIGSIFTEIGAVDNRKNVQNFINTKFKNQQEKTKQQLNVYRNMMYGIWEKTNLYDFMGRLNTLNSTLNNKRKINLYVSNNRNPNDEEISTMDNFQKYFKKNWQYKRDSLIASNIITTFDNILKTSNRKKALVIMNFRHAFSKSLSNDGTINVGEYLKRHYGNKFANVLINGIAFTTQIAKSDVDKPKTFQDLSEILMQDGKWDASFQIANKENLGFDFQNSPFGNTYFDLWPYSKHNFNYQDIFTGFAFYLPIEKHRDSYGIKGITDGHEVEIYKKDSLMMKSLRRELGTIDEIKENSKVKVENSYDDLAKMILIKNQWMKK